MPKNDPQFDGYITLKEAAKISGYSADYIGQLIRKGKIRGRQVYTNIAWVTTEEDLRAYLSGQGLKEKKEKQLPAFLGRTLSHSGWPMRLMRLFLWFALAFAVFSALVLFYALVTSSDRAVSAGAIRSASRISVEKTSTNVSLYHVGK